MTVVGRALLTGICLWSCFPAAFAEVPADATEAFNQENWQEAVFILEPLGGNPDALKMLAISYYHLEDFDNAFPKVNDALGSLPEDLELKTVLLELRIARQEWSLAGELANELQEKAPGEALNFARLRVDLNDGTGNRAQAKDQLLAMVKDETVETELALWAADVLIKALLDDVERHKAYEVARLAMDRDTATDSFRYSQFLPEKQGSGKVHFDLAYRLEYDDNICLADDSRASGKEDFRQILMVDVLFEKPLEDGWSMYAQGNLFQAFHNDFDNFNYSRLKGTAGVGKSAEKSGWRFPAEVIQDRLDGNTFRTSVAVLPAFYVQFSKDFFSHFYARIQSDDYEFLPIPGFNANPDEDRSGDVNGLGVLLAGQISPQLNLRSYIEFNRYDTKGSLWKRDEMVAFAYGEYTFSENWTAGVAVRYQDEDFDNPRSSEFNQQSESKELYLNLTRKFGQKWTWRGQLSFIDHESNVPIFDYERNLYSFSVSREF